MFSLNVLSIVQYIKHNTLYSDIYFVYLVTSTKVHKYHQVIIQKHTFILFLLIALCIMLFLKNQKTCYFNLIFIHKNM